MITSKKTKKFQKVNLKKSWKFKFKFIFNCKFSFFVNICYYYYYFYLKIFSFLLNFYVAMTINKLN